VNILAQTSSIRARSVGLARANTLLLLYVQLVTLAIRLLLLYVQLVTLAIRP